MGKNKTLTSFVFRFLRPHKFAYTILLLCTFSLALDNTVWPYILRVVVDILDNFDLKRGEALSALKVPLLAGVLLWLLIDIGFRLQGFLIAYMIPKLEANIRVTLFEEVLTHSPKYFSEQLPGKLANKISDMTTHISLALRQILTVMIPVTIGCIFAISFFFAVQPIFAILLAAVFLVYFLIIYLGSIRAVEKERKRGELRSSLLGKMVDSFINSYAVNLFFRFSYEKGRMMHLQREEEEKNREVKKYVELVRVFAGISVFLGSVFGVFGYMFHLWFANRLTTGEVVQIFSTTWAVVTMIWYAGGEVPALIQSVGISRQALSLLDAPKDVVDKEGAKALVVTKGDIAFENVTFHYGQKRLFQNKCVHIKGGEKVGLIGYSGVGKSTFVNLILRFYELEKGRILIDGQDISLMTFESLRSQIALIPQDPLLFQRTLAENIGYGRVNATREEIMEAAKLAHCTEFIKKLPQGFDTLLGENGTQLSGGERQRIAIARAILANAPVLLLDEATSALDAITEKYIQNSLSKLMQGKTTIAIAHRLSTLSKMDRLLVFDQGKIVESGSHDELLNLQGQYARMWSMQQGGFLPEGPLKKAPVEQPPVVLPPLLPKTI
jgi:ATP-binding cassette subfamily B protein